MRTFILASLGLNILVLVPVCYGMVRNADWAVSAYGPDSGARSILLAVYLSILLISIAMLIRPVSAMVASLLLVQVVYKVITPFSVGTLNHPVVLSNLAIAAVHSVTLFMIWKEIKA